MGGARDRETDQKVSNCTYTGTYTGTMLDHGALCAPRQCSQPLQVLQMVGGCAADLFSEDCLALLELLLQVVLVAGYEIVLLRLLLLPCAPACPLRG